MKIWKNTGNQRPITLAKASATVIPPASWVALSSGLAVEAVAASAALGFCPWGAAAGETTVQVYSPKNPDDIIFEGTGDAVFAASQRGTEVDLVMAAASMTTGVPGITAHATWAALTNTGKFVITINGVTYTINPDFTGDGSMADVAASLQAAIRSATSGSETVTWDATNSKFVFTSAVVTAASEMSALSTPADSIDLAAAAYLNGHGGSAVLTTRRQLVDVGSSSTDVFEILASEDAGEVGVAAGIRFKLNKPL